MLPDGQVSHERHPCLSQIDGAWGDGPEYDRIPISQLDKGEHWHTRSDGGIYDGLEEDSPLMRRVYGE